MTLCQYIEYKTFQNTMASSFFYLHSLGIFKMETSVIRTMQLVTPFEDVNVTNQSFLSYFRVLNLIKTPTWKSKLF